MSSYKSHPKTDIQKVQVANPSLDVNVVSGSLGEINVGDITIGAVEISGGTYLTKPVEISGGTYLTKPVEISGETNVNLTTYNDDAFGRLRVSEPYTLFDFTSVFGKQPLYFDEEISGSATSTHNEGSFITMSVNGSDGARVVRQTREYIPYQSGKSKLIYTSGVLTDNTERNFTSRLGAFDNSSGHFFEYSNGTISFVERDNGNEIRATRNNWIDPLDGTGSSGLNIDFTKAQIFWFDLEWLGVGRVRAGIIINGKYLQCVHFNHNGSNALLKPYYRLAKLPIRYEIQSHGDLGTLRMICGTVMSEGGFNNLGIEFSTKDYTTRSIDQNNDGLVPVISLRLRDISGTEPHLYATMKLKSFDIINTENSRVLGWKIIWNPTLTLNNGSFEDYHPEYSSARICYHGTNDSVSDGVVLKSGLANQKASFSLSSSPDEIISTIGVGRSISGVSDTITLACQALTGGNTNIDFFTTMSWIEIR